MRRFFLVLAILVAMPSEAAEIFELSSTHPSSRAVINQLYPRPLSGAPPQLATTYLYWYSRAPMPVIRFNSIDLTGQLIGALPGCLTVIGDEYAYVADVSSLVGGAVVDPSPALLVAVLVSIVPDPARDVILFNSTVPLTEGLETRALETLNVGRLVTRVSFDLLLAPRSDVGVNEIVTLADQFWAGGSLVLTGQWTSHTDYDTTKGLLPNSYTLRYDVARGTFDCTNAFGLLVTLSSESSDPLVAEAGPDQNVECAGGGTSVILDGSGSSDDAQTYDWFENDTLLGSGEVLPTSLPFGTHIVRLRVTSGKNVAEDTVTITVRDTTPPNFGAPDDVTLYTGASSCGAFFVQKAELVIDSCSGKGVHVEVAGAPANNIYPVGQTTIVWTATDDSGNQATDTQTITVIDDAPPLLKCAPPLSADTAPGQCLAAVDFPGAVTDNCPGVTLTSSPGSGSWFPPGATTVNVIATDASGNTATCAFEVTVRDIEPPSIFAPANIQANTNSGICNAAVCPGVPAFTDNCPGTTLTSARGDNLPLNAPFTRGTTLLTWTATDRSGNTAAANQNVRVSDDEAPVISGLAVDKPQLSPANGKMVDVMVNYQIFENCGNATTTLNVTSNELPGDEPDWEIVDAHHVRLRAERDPAGAGRVYTITVQSLDPDNHTTIQSVTVVVGKK